MRYLILVLLLACAPTEPAHPVLSPSPTASKTADTASASTIASDSLPRAIDSIARHDTINPNRPYSSAYVLIEPDSALAAARADGKVSRAGSELRITLLNGKTATFLDDTTAGLKFFLPRYVRYR